MKRLWISINNLKIRKITKTNLYLGLLILINIVIGGALWGVVGRHVLPGIDWLLCFMGYPAFVFGFFGGVIYLYKHEFA